MLLHMNILNLTESAVIVSMMCSAIFIYRVCSLFPEDLSAEGLEGDDERLCENKPRLLLKIFPLPVKIESGHLAYQARA